jgi:hypothetical protein
MANLIFWHAFTEGIIALFHVSFDESKIVMVFSVSFQLLYVLQIIAVSSQCFYYSFLTLRVGLCLSLLLSPTIVFSSIAIERPRHAYDFDWVIRTSFDGRRMRVNQIWISQLIGWVSGIRVCLIDIFFVRDELLLIFFRIFKASLLFWRRVSHEKFYSFHSASLSAVFYMFFYCLWSEFLCAERAKIVPFWTVFFVDSDTCFSFSAKLALLERLIVNINIEQVFSFLLLLLLHLLCLCH